MYVNGENKIFIAATLTPSHYMAVHEWRFHLWQPHGQDKRAITLEEHQQIISAEVNSERKALY
jgi:hypothetical protein